MLDPIDGTKGFMTGQGYVIGLALLDAHGDAVSLTPRQEANLSQAPGTAWTAHGLSCPWSAQLVGVMGVPPEEEAPPIMAAVKGHGLKWFNAQGAAPVPHEPPRPAWADAGTADAPPWLISPQKAAAEYVPFGEKGAGLQTICCGAMIKYFACAAGRVAGFVQYEQSLKTWDHACGLICVAESGGAATDANGAPVLFPDRAFGVEGGVVCAAVAVVRVPELRPCGR